MRALLIDIRINSLYSIRIPFTWQSALTYPVLPPSAIIGMLANAMQRYKNDKHPLEYLDLIENDLIWAGSRLLSPCVIKSYTTSAIVKWEGKLGDKFTNALGRQYAYSKMLQVAAVFKSDSFLTEIADAVKTTPLTCGDSESLATIEEVKIIPKVEEAKTKLELNTKFPVPFDLKKIEILKGSGPLYLIHERCKKTNKQFPLVSYLFPLEEKNGILYPTELLIKPRESVSILEIEGIGKVVKSL